MQKVCKTWLSYTPWLYCHIKDTSDIDYLQRGIDNFAKWTERGMTGLCSYRVRSVGGSCAEHLTVESYTIIISLQS